MKTNDSQTAGQPAAAIDLRGIGVLRDNRWILKDITWAVQPGTMAAVLGPNGSGKSTLARIAACHLWPTAGRCAILGGVFGETNLPELRKQIRLVQQAGPYDVDQNLTAREVVLTGFFGSIGLYGKVSEAMTDQAQSLLRQVGLARVLDHTYSTLSSGEKVRALIARAMVTRPRLLILDEPTAGLDLLAREQVLATMQVLLGLPHAPTVVLITHHVEELPPNCANVLLLSEGSSAAQGSMEVVLRPEVLSRVYGFAVNVRSIGGRYFLEIHPSAWNDLIPRDPHEIE
ncbi:MAG: ATP-binding cassette domain-containing protein [Planctomycetota bacterium]|nr:ATP-binding cassette domain-containing protein [Planctomycetota bacterium]